MKAVASKLLRSSFVLPVLLVVLSVALVATVLVRTGVVQIGQPAAKAATAARATPENVAVEAQLGVRFSHVAVLGGGGLVELTYTVLDPERATTFQSDTLHPPTINLVGDEQRSVHVSALMKQGHDLRPGQTYFILYENPGGVLKSGDLAEIRSKAGTLSDFPVE